MGMGRDLVVIGILFRLVWSNFVFLDACQASLLVPLRSNGQECVSDLNSVGRFVFTMDSSTYSYRE